MCKLKIFDFDSTLVLKPTIYDWEPNDNEEDNEYMESTRSLEYEFELNEIVIKEYKEADKCDNTLKVLLTNRTAKLEKEVAELLKERGIEFDIHLFRKEDRSKGNRLHNLLNSIPNVDYVEFFDDKHKHLKDIFRISTIFPEVEFKLNKVYPNYLLEC